jgi:hypothetical protein
MLKGFYMVGVEESWNVLAKWNTNSLIILYMEMDAIGLFISSL